jgi:hypothetical protein
VAYEMRGQFLEACDCYVMCPCWFEQDPHDNECTGLVAWQIEEGRIDGVDVAAMRAVSVSHHGGHRGAAKALVVLFIDERSSEEQERALTAVFTGEQGGPLAELAQMTQDHATVQRATIEFTSDGASTAVTVGQRVTAAMQPLIGSTGRIITVADSALASLLGTPAEVGKSSSYSLDLSGRAFDMEVRGRSANRGRFAYVSSDG